MWAKRNGQEAGAGGRVVEGVEGTACSNIRGRAPSAWLGAWWSVGCGAIC